MTEPNGNAKIGNIIAGAGLGFAIFSACALAIIRPIERDIFYLSSELKEFKSNYQKYHDDLDIRLQREMRDVNEKTEQKVTLLGENLDKEIKLNMRILEEKVEGDKNGRK